MKLAIDDLLKQTLKEASKKDMISHCETNNFAPGKLRLIPKGETFRPIMTFNRKVPHNKNLTTNNKLQHSHMMLKNLKSKLYFVAMDIEKCYDNVDPDKLSTFLGKTDLLDKEYFMLNCFVLKRKNNMFIEKKDFKK